MQAKMKKGVTVVTGHLGSGKTTFIKKILKAFPEKNFLIVENEFGEIGIDGEILSTNDNALIELNSGCICCNIQSDLEMILEKVVQENPEYDHIIIEATGVANPAKIAKQFVPTTFIGHHFVLTSVLCVIDHSNYKSHQKLPEFELQLLTSDTYILSKTEDINEATSDVASELNISEASFKSPEKLTEWFFDHSFFGLDESISQKGGHHHYQKLSFEIKGEFDPHKLEIYLNILFKKYAGKIFRSKGIIYFEGNPTPAVLQGVFDSLAFEHFDSNQKFKPKDKVNQIVLIGEGLKEDVIEKSFTNCLAE